MAFIKKLRQRMIEKEKEFMSHISDDILELYTKQEPITNKIYQSLRMNSYERRLIHSLLDDETLIKITEYALCQDNHSEAGKFQIPISYTSSIISLHIHELIKRLKNKL